MKVKSRNIIVILVCLLVVNIPYLTQTVNNLKNLTVESIIVIWLVVNNIKKAALKSNCFIILFWAFMIICTFINLSFSSRLLNAFVTGLCYVLMFLTIKHVMITDSLADVMKMIFRMVFIFVLIEDISIFVSFGRGFGGDDLLSYYFLGNKFVVSYTHMFFVCIALVMNEIASKGRRHFWRMLIYMFYSLIICHIVDCNTGVVGVSIILIMYVILKIKREWIRILFNPIIFIIFFLGLNFLLVCTSFILENDFFVRLFTQFSHTNKILSGRVEMYAIAIEAIKNRLIWGYGINCTIVSDILSWGNAQNGLLKMLLDYGLLGTSSFILVCYKALLNIKTRLCDSQIVYPIVIFVYAMIICSLVEINLGSYFFLALAILNGYVSKVSNIS